MNKKDCTACRKVTEKYIKGICKWHRRYYRKYIANIETCGK